VAREPIRYGLSVGFRVVEDEANEGASLTTEQVNEICHELNERFLNG
jgi:hypothetical protein